MSTQSLLATLVTYSWVKGGTRGRVDGVVKPHSSPHTTKGRRKPRALRTPSSSPSRCRSHEVTECVEPSIQSWPGWAEKFSLVRPCRHSVIYSTNIYWAMTSNPKLTRPRVSELRSLSDSRRIMYRRARKVWSRATLWNTAPSYSSEKCIYIYTMCAMN